MFQHAKYNNMFFLYVLVFLALGNKLGNAFSWFSKVDHEKDETNWNQLSAKFMKFTKLPMTAVDAKQDGWIELTQACYNGHFNGTQFTQDQQDKTRTLLYDANGKVAGIQMIFSNKLRVAKHMVGGPIRDIGGFYIITAYFTNPARICEKGNIRKPGQVGEKLILSTGKDSFMEVPLLEKDIGTTKWVKGKCFYGMGQHYWYNINSKMSCDDFFPYFVLYNKGKLNGFGFATGSNINSGNVEHPPKSLLGFFFQSDTRPQCLSNEKHLSTQHVYLQSWPLFNRC